jgi:hypothetical protein
MNACVWEMKRRGRSRKQLVDDIKETGSHCILKEEVLNYSPSERQPRQIG